ncbi:alpha/beta hydrolase [Streptomyces cinereoruber]|uniref:Alpha/beta hydrolase n=1 Tax=Streptomyces cinereoruber TaxID=67260 RepID=A0ABX6BPK5_9ACTN|nr:alpha/beta hydrolase [Streptomyces cinereoruber]MBY8819238.1 alpha/beta hydrolase [Streptomyces cinereoruber]QEV36018.1 alpha/beta hydrolase [Streptomyces cinereoruber]
MQSVRFKNRSWDVAADLRLPKDFDPSKKYPAIICAHPISSCKEQTSGSIYGERLTEQGYVTLAFDASHQGESGGEPRYLEDPATRVEDFRCAVDHLVTLDYVDENRIGCLGVCGGGGYAANATMTEHRIKALVTVVAANYGRIMRESGAIDTLEAISRQRTAEARGAEPLITTYIPGSPEEREQAGATDIDIVDAVEYYRTPRSQDPNSPNRLRFSGLDAAVGFDAFHLAEVLLTQPLQVIVGDVPGAFGSYRDGFELFNRARSEKKDILVVQGASHYDLYDRPEYTDQALRKLESFFGENL